MDQDGNYFPKDKLYLLTGDQLNIVVWAVSLLVDDFPPGSEGRQALEETLRALMRKESYDKLLDRMGVPKAPSEKSPEDIKKLTDEDMIKLLEGFGLKPPDKSERN